MTSLKFWSRKHHGNDICDKCIWGNLELTAPNVLSLGILFNCAFSVLFPLFFGFFFWLFFVLFFSLFLFSAFDFFLFCFLYLMYFNRRLMRNLVRIQWAVESMNLCEACGSQTCPSWIIHIQLLCVLSLFLSLNKIFFLFLFFVIFNYVRIVRWSNGFELVFFLSFSYYCILFIILCFPLLKITKMCDET